MQIQVGVITVSDRAAKGLYDDLGGPALKGAADGYGWKVLAETLVPDEKRDIQRAIREQINKGCHLILTTGGTGVALRDVTPEAVREIGVRELPGFGEAMRMESLKITRNAILSRNLAAVVDKTLVICLPGKPSGAVECLGFVVEAIPHALKCCRKCPRAVSSHGTCMEKLSDAFCVLTCMNLESLIASARQQGASDLHFEPGLPAALRIRGSLRTAGEPVPPQALFAFVRHL